MNYNQGNYNVQRYDIQGVAHATSLNETVTGADVKLASPIKVLFDSMTVADATISLMPDLGLTDLFFLEDSINIQFTNKALNDTVRLADWLSIERSPAQNNWYD